jgi:nitrite reductase/ring-hydroxylating ferredoxin subunit
MERYRVAKAAEFVDLKPIFVDVPGSKIGVYRVDEKYYAYANHCPHQAGPACEGIVVGDIETEIKQGHAIERISNKRWNIACPWHGMEFDLETGRCRADRRYRLQSYEVVVEGEDVLVKK